MPRHPTVLLTLGRLPVSLEIARSFAGGGWRVVVADPWGMHLCRMSKAVSACHRVPSPQQGLGAWQAALNAIIHKEAVDLVVPVSEETLSVAAADLDVPVFTRDKAALLDLHDKQAFAERAAGLGLSVPATARGDERPAFTQAAPFVTKPRFSCSGRGVRFYAAGESFDADPALVVQARADGDALSSFCIARDGEILASLSYRPVILDGSVAVAFERVDQPAAVSRWVEQFIAGVSHTGFIAFDFILGSEAVAIECNPRATSGIHFIEREALLRMMTGDPVSGSPFRAERYLCESYSCFTALLAALPRGKAIDVWRAMRRSRDVCWSTDDPWPFLGMNINSWPIIRRAAFGGHSFASAAIADVEWKPDA